MTVRGTTLYPSAVEDVLRRLPSVGEWQLHHDGSAQRPILLAEWTGPDAADQRATAVVVERLRTALQVTVEIRWLEPGEIPAPDGSKIRRFGRDDLRSSSATH